MNLLLIVNIIINGLKKLNLFKFYRKTCKINIMVQSIGIKKILNLNK